MLSTIRLLGAGAVMASALLVTACRPSPAPALEGSWVLRPDVLGTPPPAEGGSPVTATFSGGPPSQVSGSAGCNGYTAPYTREGNRLTIGQLTSTAMVCGPEAMRIEHAFLTRLRGTTGYRIDAAGVLHLDTTGGGLRFDRVRPVPPTTTPTTVRPSPAGQWRVTAYRNPIGLVAVEPGVGVRLELLDDGTLRGRACNILGGRWAIGRAGLVLDAQWMTEMTCPSPPLADLDAHFLQTVRAVQGWEVDAGGSLTLLRGTEVMITAVPAR